MRLVLIALIFLTGLFDVFMAGSFLFTPLDAGASTFSSSARYASNAMYCAWLSCSFSSSFSLSMCFLAISSQSFRSASVVARA